MTFEKGCIPWNKGKVNILSEETRQKLSKVHKGKKRPPFSKEWKKRMSKAKVGCTPWNKGKKFSKPTKRQVAYWNFLKGKNLSKERIKKILARRTPSSLEEKFQQIIDKFGLPYRYVGNGVFFI